MDKYVFHISLASIMRRILTGYVVNFNRRHRRYGHLFQNRYKSIVCQEDVYLKELVRYIQLRRSNQGSRPELVGGGLIRSMGGWSSVLAVRSRGERQVNDIVHNTIKQPEKVNKKLKILKEISRILILSKSGEAYKGSKLIDEMLESTGNLK